MSHTADSVDPQRGEKWSPELDEGPHRRAQIGYVLVANADLSEADFFAMKPPGVGVHFTRVPMPREVGVATLAAMERDLSSAAASMMPGRDDLDVISYSCTSGTFVIGEEQVIAELRRPPSAAGNRRDRSRDRQARGVQQPGELLALPAAGRHR